MKFYNITAPFFALLTAIGIDGTHAFSFNTQGPKQPTGSIMAENNKNEMATCCGPSPFLIRPTTIAPHKIIASVATMAAALTLSTHVALASDLNPSDSTSSSSSFSPQTVLLAAASRDAGDPFALPNYSDSIKNKSIDLDLETVNKRITEEAARKRDDSNVDKENNQRFIDLRKQEEEEEKRLQRMRDYAKKEREEAIKREKAEIAANRWNTF